MVNFGSGRGRGSGAKVRRGKRGGIPPVMLNETHVDISLLK
jgi:hypothetical protein